MFKTLYFDALFWPFILTLYLDAWFWNLILTLDFDALFWRFMTLDAWIEIALQTDEWTDNANSRVASRQKTEGAHFI